MEILSAGQIEYPRLDPRPDAPHPTQEIQANFSAKGLLIVPLPPGPNTLPVGPRDGYAIVSSRVVELTHGAGYGDQLTHSLPIRHAARPP